MNETRDALGRLVTVGDIVGGAVFGRYPDTVWGMVARITATGQVRVKLLHGSGGGRPERGDVVLLPRDRIFRLDVSPEQAGHGPCDGTDCPCDVSRVRA